MKTLKATCTLWAVIILAATSSAANDRAEPSPETLMRQQAIQRIESDWGNRASLSGRPGKAGFDARCLPTCDITDGRFLVIAGSEFQTLGSPELELEISAPAGTETVQIGVFDGDGGEYQADGETANWDSGVTADFEYSLFADPLADGTGRKPIALIPGLADIPSSMFPDNDWLDFKITTSPEAQSPSGNYFYVLHIRLVDSSLTTLNAFKVRSSSFLSGVSLLQGEHPFSYIASWTALSDISTVYPKFPAATPTNYDGTFRFYFDVPTSQSELVVWDGDFDRGAYDLTDQDTDDPDTPGAPFLPSWSTPEARAEGLALGGRGGTGEPADNDDPSDFGAFIVRNPDVRYDLRFPDGKVFSNDNPSGNREWEQFKISTSPFDSSEMDYSNPSIPPGVYSLTIQGLDMLNLNAFLFPFRLLCVDENGAPCQGVPRPYAIGDTVFEDRNSNGSQGSNDPGLPDVVLELRDLSGELISTATTDASGRYRFEVESGDYVVAVAAANFDVGGTLEGYMPTTPQQHTDTVAQDNVLTYDFGYRGTGEFTSGR